MQNTPFFLFFSCKKKHYFCNSGLQTELSSNIYKIKLKAKLKLERWKTHITYVSCYMSEGSYKTNNFVKYQEKSCNKSNYSKFLNTHFYFLNLSLSKNKAAIICEQATIHIPTLSSTVVFYTKGIPINNFKLIGERLVNKIT